jgi:hypothetical protein
MSVPATDHHHTTKNTMRRFVNVAYHCLRCEDDRAVQHSCVVRKYAYRQYYSRGKRDLAMRWLFVEEKHCGFDTTYDVTGMCTRKLNFHAYPSTSSNILRKPVPVLKSPDDVFVTWNCQNRQKR